MDDEFLNQEHHHTHRHHEPETTPVPTDIGIQKRAEGLLKYEKPYFVQTHDKKINWNAKILTAADMAPAITGTTKLLNAELTRPEIEEFLSVIFPPIEWEENGHLFRQKVSSLQATEEDLQNLEKEVERRLSYRHALDEGLCDARREIFEQCLDEVLRQVTIENPERGFVLRRIRDELRMTFNVYRTLFESSVAYSTRKSLLIESSHSELDRTIEESDEALVELRKHVAYLHKEYDQLEAEQDELEEADEKRREQEIEFYKDINTQLKNKLDKFLSPHKKGIGAEKAHEL